MLKSAVLTATSIGLLTLSLVTPGAVAARGEGKQDGASARTITPKFRQKLSQIDKSDRPSKSLSSNLSAKRTLGAGVRAEQFANRAATRPALADTATPGELPARLQERRPHLANDTNKVQGVPAFDGRKGTGLGDVSEASAGGDPDLAQILADLPGNVVGAIDTFNDVDFYAFKASAGEEIRVEVLSDRLIETGFDSFLYLVDDEEDVLATNDDAFANSLDSFIAFRAPYTGVYYVGVTDSRGVGDFDFDYVLNVSPSRDDIDEDESNDRLDNADDLPLPSTAFGRSNDNDDQDVFEIKGVAGQALIVDVDADILLSDMDAVVELYDSGSKLLFFSDDFDGRDPRFNIVLPYTGTYYLIVYDLNNSNGSLAHFYSMNVSTQNAALAPRATNYKTQAGRLKTVKGTGFDPSNGGSTVEIDGETQASFNVPAKPTTTLKLNPTGFLSGSDSITVVNPDGRRSNPIVLR